jgi:predicted RND superfamily exporter protein
MINETEIENETIYKLYNEFCEKLNNNKINYLIKNDSIYIYVDKDCTYKYCNFYYFQHLYDEEFFADFYIRIKKDIDEYNKKKLNVDDVYLEECINEALSSSKCISTIFVIALIIALMALLIICIVLTIK